MSNETLILKSGVSTGSTIKLTDCPIKSGEILETVCRLYANGLTSGNRAIKALGESVKYNTEAVSNGSLYCVAYKDGGFYVGARESEDYEPKVGDWWLIKETSHKYSFSSNWWGGLHCWKHNEASVIFGSVPVYGLDNFGMIAISPKNIAPLDMPAQKKAFVQFKNWSAFNPTSTKIINYFETSIAGGVIRPGWFAEDDDGYTFGKNEPVFLCYCKPVTSSDILAYQATGHMGALFLGGAMDKSVAVSSKRLASETAIFIDNEAVPCTLVGGTLYITNTAVSGDITSAGDVYEVLKDNTETATTLSMEDSV